MLDRSFLARFLACDVPEDVRRWVLTLMHEAMSPSERKAERDRWFRAGAALVPGESWTRARRLHQMAREMRGAIPAAPDTRTARGCVAAALLACVGPVPSLKTIGRIVDTIG